VRVLLLEDDDALRSSIASVLRSRGDAVDEATTLAEADERLYITDYDVAVLDRTVPGGDSAALARRARADGVTTPILFLTALDGIEQRVAGLDAGGDDYLAKPFAMAELLARLRSLGRRSASVQAPVLTLADLVVDPAQLTAQRGGRALTLTAKELAILVYLLRNSGRVVSRTDLIEHCWDEYADPRSNVVDVRMRLLRQKLGEPALVHTVRGAGYVAREPDAEGARPVVGGDPGTA
jgi:DNA-binding response OmpR family regulator